MFTIPLLVLAGIWWLVYLAVRKGRHAVHQPRPPFPTRVPVAPPPPKKPEPTVVHIRLL
jgi:hypothetical protein